MRVLSRPLIAALVCAGMAALTGCSGARPTAAAGSPDFYWAAAGRSYAAGDYLKTLEQLDNLLKAPGSYQAKAIPWRIVVTAGLARGYADLADRYTLGARLNRASIFRVRAAKYRTMAGGLALRLAQQAEDFAQEPLGQIPLVFPFPRGNAGQPPALIRIASGFEPAVAEQDAAEAVALERGILMAVCEAAGAPNDVAKAGAILAAESPSVSRQAFGDAMALSLVAQASLFERDRLDEPANAALVKQKLELLRAESARVGSARIGMVVSAASPQ